MKIVVLAGGTSTERNISIITSVKVCESLQRNGHMANMADVFFGINKEKTDTFFAKQNDPKVLGEELKEQTEHVNEELERRAACNEGFFGPGILDICKEADIVFIGLHGSNGEDGKIQAAFDLMGIRYTGTDYISSAICMNKALTKKVLVSEGVPMPKGTSLQKGHKIEYVPFPCVIKPCCGGSSVGVSIVNSEEEFNQALNEAFSYEDHIIVEEYIEGRELSVGVLNGKALPIIEITPLEGFYDYSNKYKAGAAKETCPADLPEDITKKLQYWAEKACHIIGVTTYARVDAILDKDGELFCLEVNTLPGMTDTSLIPQEAQAVGISYDALTQMIVDVSLEKYK